MNEQVNAAFQLLISDQTDTGVKSTAKQSTSDALAVAQHADDAAGNDLNSAKLKQNADLDSLKTLLETSFRVA